MELSDALSGNSLEDLAALLAARLRPALADDIAAALAAASPPPDEGRSGLLDIDDVASALKVSRRTVDSLVAGGELPVIRIGQGKGVRRFERAAVDALIRRRARTVGSGTHR